MTGHCSRCGEQVCECGPRAVRVADHGYVHDRRTPVILDVTDETDLLGLIADTQTHTRAGRFVVWRRDGVEVAQFPEPPREE